MMLKGKTVLLGVTGSIAAYKIANLASMLVKLHCNVHVIMTKNATNFINPITFETLTNNRCIVDTFDRNFQYNVEHVSLAKQADVMMIAPASANVIAKLSHGLADDMLTTTALACTCNALRHLLPVTSCIQTDDPEHQIGRKNAVSIRKARVPHFEKRIQIFVYVPVLLHMFLQIVGPFFKFGFYIDENLAVHQNYYTDF